MDVTVKSHYTYWTECPISERKSLFDDSVFWKTQAMGEDSEYVSKRQRLLFCVHDALNARKTQVIQEIYELIKPIILPNNIDPYPAILLWIRDNMRNGYLTDNYTLLVYLADYYWGIKDYKQSLYYLEDEFSQHEDIIKDYQSRHNKPREVVVDQFYYAIILHQIVLNDAGLFDESRQFQRKCVELGYIETLSEKQELRTMANIWFRLEAELQAHKAAGIIMPQIDDILALERMERKEYAATGYKKLADLYYNTGDYETAIVYYEKAISLWSIVYGAQTKLQRAKNKLLKQ